MTSGENVVSIDDVLICSICKDFYEKPVLIDCCHNFCKECLFRYIYESEQCYPECPVCQKPVTVCQKTVESDSELRINTVLQKVVDILKGHQGVRDDGIGNVTCQVCNESIVRSNAQRCVDCNIVYCSVCRSAYHPNIGVFSKHTIRLLSKTDDKVEIPTECTLHRKDLVYLCLDCRRPVCFDCQNESHAAHTNFEVLSKAYLDESKKISSQVEESKSVHSKFELQMDSEKNKMLSLKNKQSLRVKCIRDCFQSLREALDAKEKELLDKEEVIVDRPIRNHEASMQKVENERCYLENILSMSDVVIRNGKMIPLLLMSRPLDDGHHTYRSALSTYDFSNTPCIPDIPETINISNTLESISSLGVELSFNMSKIVSEGCPANEHLAQDTFDVESMASDFFSGIENESYQARDKNKSTMGGHNIRKKKGTR